MWYLRKQQQNFDPFISVNIFLYLTNLFFKNFFTKLGKLSIIDLKSKDKKKKKIHGRFLKVSKIFKKCFTFLQSLGMYWWW